MSRLLRGLLMGHQRAANLAVLVRALCERRLGQLLPAINNSLQKSNETTQERTPGEQRCDLIRNMIFELQPEGCGFVSTAASIPGAQKDASGNCRSPLRPARGGPAGVAEAVGAASNHRWQCFLWSAGPAGLLAYPPRPYPEP